MNPNGTWSLYVVDDLGADVGTITGGWALNITVERRRVPVPDAEPNRNPRNTNTDSFTNSFTNSYSNPERNPDTDVSSGDHAVHEPGDRGGQLGLV